MKLDKYQEYVLTYKKFLPSRISNGYGGYNQSSTIKYGYYYSQMTNDIVNLFFSNGSDDDIVVTQDFEITSLKYTFSIAPEFNSLVSKIEVKKNDKWCESKEVVFDFENRVDALKIFFNDEIVKPITLNVVYKEADKNAYYERIRLQKQEEMDKYVFHTIGADTFNIFWKESKTVKIQLYVLNPNTNSRNQNNKDYWKVDTMSFGDGKTNMAKNYVSVTGLVKGTYKYEFEGVSVKGELITTTKDFQMY